MYPERGAQRGQRRAGLPRNTIGVFSSMGLPESRQKLSGVFSRRRFQALAAAGVLAVGLGAGGVSGVFAAPSTQSLMAAVTPVAASGTPGATNPGGGPGHGPGGFGRFGRGPGGPGMMGGQFFGPVAT